MQRKRVAVVGSGCSGIGALWALKNSAHDVHLFEADSRLGGHTNTVSFKNGDHVAKVDTGFIVMNTATYPNFVRFLKEIGLATVPTVMTFAVSRDAGLFEWAGTSLSTIFAQKMNLLNPSMWRMIFDIIRFNQYALDVISNEDRLRNMSSGTKKSNTHLQESIGEYLERNNYSDKFRNDYLVPMTACVWSTSPEKCSLSFPATTLIRFLWNHHLLSTLSSRPPWLTIPGGSQQYIDAVLKYYPSDRIHLSAPVESVLSDAGKIVLRTSTGLQETFDHVILATHGDQAFDLIRKTATDDEIAILECFETSKNTAVLHSDISLMPRNRRTWSSWNYLTTTSDTSKAPTTVSLTYSMNILQHVSTFTMGDVLVSLNPPHPPAPRLVQGTYSYSHPLYTARAVDAQEKLSQIQNTRGISYCGAWTGYGFHEDGFTSGLKVAIEHLGAKIPFEVVDSKYSRGRRPQLRRRDYAARAIITIIQAMISIWLWIWELLITVRFMKVKRS